MRGGWLRTFSPWFLVLAVWLARDGLGHAAGDQEADWDWHALVASGQLVEIAKVDPTIKIEMRYATPDNCLGKPIYPPDLPCLIRPEIANRLIWTQHLLRERGFGLKVWDAYRPLAAQREIWQRFARRGYVADPDDGRGSLHTWGLAVDVTVVDSAGKDLIMPSAFDDLSPAASAIYHGTDMRAFADLRLLHAVMMGSGFIGLSTEWWHFAARDWRDFGRLKPVPRAAVTPDGG